MLEYVEIDPAESAKYRVSEEGTAFIAEELLRLTLLPDIDEEKDWTQQGIQGKQKMIMGDYFNEKN